jgi:hypothetical protein
MRQLVTFGELSNHVDTTGTGSMRKSVRFWDNKLRTTGTLLRVESPGKARTSEENVNRMREAFQRSSGKSVRAASLQLHTNSTFNSARCATQKASPKIQIFHAQEPSDQVACTNFAVDMLGRTDAPPNILYQVCCSD